MCAKQKAHCVCNALIENVFPSRKGIFGQKNGAVDEARTRDLHLGKVALYQLSYYRIINRVIPGADENRNAFTAKPHPGIDRFDNGIIIQDLHGICKSESGGNALFFSLPGMYEKAGTLSAPAVCTDKRLSLRF